MMRTGAILLLFLPSAVADADDGYELFLNDHKCPFGEERLFRTRDNAPLTVSQCYQLCYNTEGCNYFSIGVSTDARHVGVCIGCEQVELSTHKGFDSYNLKSTQDFPMDASSCLKDADEFPINGCEYESLLNGLDELLEEEYWRCPGHNAEAVMESLFANNPTEAKNAVTTMCSAAWNEVPVSTFQHIDDRFTDNFMEEYISGDTFLNHDTGTFQGTTEGANIDNFRDAEATTTVLQAIPSLSNCAYNAIMCCFGRDRQPNDNNGNCADPIETNCHHADPADNSNLCWTDTDIPTFSDPFAFPEKSEGPIHCHGLAWGDKDENSFLTHLRFNNFFYVSLYDHMYTRGYVEPMVDSDNIGMCNCIEDMPVVSRSDCTQVDATQTFTITFENGNFAATKTGDMDVEFNACQGIDPSTGRNENNDLGSYVYRLNQEGTLSEDKMNGVFSTLYGFASPNDNQNEAGCEETYRSHFNEEYPENVAGLKCPLHSSERLFRTEDDNPLTLEQCQALCYETQFCEFFSLGVKARGDHHGICIGCTSSAVLQTDSGFNSYQMTSTQSFPTATPTPEPDSFDAVGTGKKCPHNRGTRLFRTPDNEPLTRQQCYERCYNTEGCHYFSLGEATDRQAWMGVCMGCTADSVLSDHDGFNAYEMEIKQAFPTAAPTTTPELADDTSDLYELRAQDKKCPFNNRLFKGSEPLTREECYQKCNDHPTCELFTLGEGENIRSSWKGLCMGCSGGAVPSSHKGFNTYAILP